MAAERAVMAVLDFLSLFIERADHIAAAFAKRSRYIEGSACQSLGEHLRA